jgi:hypothetical protein
MIVTVDVRHIGAAKFGSSRRNPLALAVSEATGKEFRVSPLTFTTEDSALMAYRWADVDDRGTRGIVDKRELPPECTAFYDAFEVYQPVSPFAFDLPDEEVT